MGGGIAAHFASTFPHMVSSLVLLAPAGIIREENFGLASRLLFRSGIVPDRLLTGLTRRRLRQPIASSVTKKKSPTPTPPRDKTPTGPDGITDSVGVSAHKLRTSLHHLEDSESMTDLATAETAVSESVTALERRVLDYIAWMADHHPGFVPAFLSSLRHAPLMNQHDTWRELASRPPDSTCVLLARDDEIIDPEDYRNDGLELLGGEERVKWRVIGDGHDFVGHDFVMTHTGDILKELDEFWGA